MRGLPPFAGARGTARPPHPRPPRVREGGVFAYLVGMDGVRARRAAGTGATPPAATRTVRDPASNPGIRMRLHKAACVAAIAPGSRGSAPRAA